MLRYRKFYDSIDVLLLANEALASDYPPEEILNGMAGHRLPRMLQVGVAMSLDNEHGLSTNFKNVTQRCYHMFACACINARVRAYTHARKYARSPKYIYATANGRSCESARTYMFDFLRAPCKAPNNTVGCLARHPAGFS